MNPYELQQEERYALAISGGRTSGFMLKQLLDANPWMRDSADVQVCFQNTGLEAPETLDFLERMQTEWNIGITWLEFDCDLPITGIDDFQLQPAGARIPYSFKVVDRAGASTNGLPMLKLIAKKRYLPDAMRRFCSQETKAKTLDRYLQSLGWRSWNTAIGFRYDEAHRLENIKKKEWSVRRGYFAPMVAAGVRRSDIVAFWTQQPFDLQLDIDPRGRTPFSNCLGCPLKAESIKAKLYRERPHEFEWYVRVERKMSELLGRKASFNQKQSMADIKEYADKHPQSLTKLDDSDLFCQKSGGECSGF